MRVADFNFNLPEELIAQHPPTTRGASRMLLLNRTTHALTDDRFSNLPAYLQPGDLLILNDSRVLPARLYATRAGLHTQQNSPHPTGRIEVLLTQQLEPHTWSALVRPSRKIQPGEHLYFRDQATGVSNPATGVNKQATGEILLEAEVLTAGDFGERTLRFSPTPDFAAILDRIGHMPLPPYIHREAQNPDAQNLDLANPAPRNFDLETQDKTRYQTVYAKTPGSAAAPTAGLHFTPEILAQLRHNGVQIETLTLHVGLGTFQPVRVDDLADIRLHAEHYTLPAATAEAINLARAQRRRIIVAGTTTTRTLEHCARIAAGEPLQPHSGQTSIFLSPGHKFQIVTGLLTNFHLPQSTLLMLVSAFAHPETGREIVLNAYAHAIAQRYRFFSYGDAMLLL